jgi:hypothetical protein
MALTGVKGLEGGGVFETEKIKKSMMNEVKLNYRIMWKFKYFQVT